MANATSPINLATQWPPVLNPNQINNAKIGASSQLPQVIAFGSDGIIYGIIVETINSTPMVSEVNQEQGSGFTSAQVLINDGDLVECVCVDDRAYTWPITGGIITVLNPQPNGTYIVSGELFQVINNNYSTGIRQYGKRTLICKKYVILTPTQL